MFLLLSLLGCPSILPAKVPEDVCGDGVWGSLEVCDPTEVQYGPWCKDDCTWQACGDGIVGPDEGCEPPSLYGTCGPTCQPRTCGSGARDDGELCLQAAEPLPVGAGVKDVALTDADNDGDLDLLLAGPEGAVVWFNDHGSFARSGLALASDSAAAVAANGRMLLLLDEDGLTVGHWLGLAHEAVFYPHGVWTTDCTAPVPGSLSFGWRGVTESASWVCAEGGFEVYVDPLWDVSRHDSTFGREGATTAFSVIDNPPEAPITWYGHPEEAWLTAAHGTGVQLALPGPARAIRPPFTFDRLKAQLVVLTDEAMVVGAGAAVTATLPTPGIVDGTAGWWDDVVPGAEPDDPPPADALEAVWIDAEGVVISRREGAAQRGPNLPGLARVLVADLDQDGFFDVAALRPEAGELHVWMQRP